MSEWQNIETAPRDGTSIMLYATHYSMLKPRQIQLQGSWRRGWWSDGGLSVPLSHVTHWQPLPSPPTSHPPA